MFKDEILEEIFSNTKLQDVPFVHLSNVIHVVEDVLEEKKNELPESEFVSTVFVQSESISD